jgi:hypothetical protein
VEIALDLGQAIGKISMVLDSIRFRQFGTENERKLLSLYSRSVSMVSVGRLNLKSTFDSPWIVVLQKSLLDFVEENDDEGGDYIVALLARIIKVSLLVEYNFEKIGIIECDSLALIMRDFWKGITFSRPSMTDDHENNNAASEKKRTTCEIELQLDFAINSLLAAISRETVPSVQRLASKIEKQFIEKRNLAMASLLTESGRASLPHPLRASAKKSITSKRPGLFVYRGLECIPIGRCTIRGAEAELKLFNGNLYESEFLSVSSVSYLLNLTKCHVFPLPATAFNVCVF